MDEPRPETIAAWTALMRASRALLERVEAALKTEGLPSLDWYDALLEIERAGPDGIRPYALTDRLLLPQYGTSRLVERVARAGLVERAPCPDDRRGQVLRITPAGQALRRRMWPVYARALQDGLETRLAPRDAETLTDLLDKLRG